MKTYVYIPGFEYDSKGPIQIDAIELHARVVGSTNELSVYTNPSYITRGITKNIIYRSTQSSTYQDTYKKYDNVISYSSPFYTEARNLGRVYHGFFYDFILENADGSLHHIIGIHDDPQECVNNVSNMNSKEHDGLFAVEINNPNTDILLDFTFYTKIVGNDAVDTNMSFLVTSGYTKICSVSKVYNPAMSANGDEGTILPTAPKLQYFDITQQSGYYWEVPVNAGVLVTRMQPENEMSDSSGKKMYKQYSYNRELRRHVLSDSLVCNNMTYQDSTDFFINFYKNNILNLGNMSNFAETSRISLDLTTGYGNSGITKVGLRLSTFNCRDSFNALFIYNLTNTDLSSFPYLYKHLPSVCILNKLFDGEFYSSSSIYPISISVDHSKLLRKSGTSIDFDDFDYVFDCHDSIYNNSLYKVNGNSLSNTDDYLKIVNNDTGYFSIKSNINYLYNSEKSTIFNSDSAYCRPNDNINWDTTPVSLKNTPYLYASRLIAQHEGSRLRCDGSGKPQYRSTYLLFTLYGNSNNYTGGKPFNQIENKSIFFDGQQRTLPLISGDKNKFGIEIGVNNIRFSGFYNTYTSATDALNNVYNNKHVPSGDVTAYLTNMIYIDLNRSNVRFSNLGDYKIIPMFINKTHGVDTSVQSPHLVESNVINDNLLANGSKPYEILNVLSEEVVFKTPFEMGYKSSFCNESRFVENTTNPLYIKQKIKLQPGIYAMRVQHFMNNADITATINDQKYKFINNALFLFVHEASEVMFNSIQWNWKMTFNGLPDFISGVGLYKININATDIKSILLKDIFSNTSGFYIRNDRDIYDLIVFNSAACARESVDFCKKNTSNLPSYYVLEYGNDYDDDAIHQIYNFPYLPEQACYDVVAFYYIPVDDVPINIVDILNSNVLEGSSLITQLKSKKARV